MKHRGRGETGNRNVYKCHTEMQLHIKKEVTKRRGKKKARSMATKIRSFGKYRLNMLIQNGRLTESINMEDEECVDIVEYDVINGVDGAADRTWTEEECAVEILKGTERLTADGIGRSVSRKREKKRHRRNNATSIDKLKLFKDGSDGRRRRGSMGRTMDVSSGVYSETELLSKSISECSEILEEMAVVGSKYPLFRSMGGRRLKHKYICVSTVRMKQNLPNSLHRLTGIISISIEEQSKKVRNIVVRNERTFNERRGCISRGTHFLCSCDMGWTVEGVVDSNCWHATEFRKNEAVIGNVDKLLSTAFDERNGMYLVI